MAEESDAAALVLTTGVRRPAPAVAVLVLSAAACAAGIPVLGHVPDVVSGPDRALWLVLAIGLLAVGSTGVAYWLAAVVEWAVTRRRDHPAVRVSGRGL